jgi:hypothetical protein
LNLQAQIATEVLPVVAAGPPWLSMLRRGSCRGLGCGERITRDCASRALGRCRCGLQPQRIARRRRPEDGTVRLFESDTGAQQLVLPSLGCIVSRVAFSPDGTKLASTSPCGGLRIWALDIDDLLEIAHREVPRALTDEECRQYLHVDQCRQV